MKQLQFICMGMFILSTFRTTAQSKGDYRTAQTQVSWADETKWQTWDGAQWVTPSVAPGKDNDVYIQAGHQVVLADTQSCRSLFISTGTTGTTTGGDGQVGLQSNVLKVFGKLACYYGAVNVTHGSSSPLSVTMSSTTPSAPVTKTSGGVLAFTGSSRNITLSNEWGANATGSNTLFDVEIALDEGQTATLQGIIKAANWFVRSGTLKTETRIAVDNGTTGQGNFTLFTGAILISGETGSGNTPVISRTTSTICGTVTLNGHLILTGASPHIQCNTIQMGSSGVVEYARPGSQTFINASYSGAATLVNYQHLILSGSGAKTTLSNVSINILSSGSLTVSGGILTLGSSATFKVDPSQTTLCYMGKSAQTASALEWDTSFYNVRIQNPSGVSLNFSRKIKGELYLHTGALKNDSGLIIGNGASIQRRAGYLTQIPDFRLKMNLIYDETGTELITGPELPADSGVLNNLTIQNSRGLRLKHNAFISGNLLLKKGIIQTSDSSMIVLGHAGKADSGSAESFVCGPMAKTGPSDFLFPVGKDSTWAGVKISNLLSSNPPTVIAEYFNSEPPGRNFKDSSLNSGILSKKEYWRLRTDSGVSAQVTLFWANGTYSGIYSVLKSDLTVAAFLDTLWQNKGNQVITGAAGSGSITSDSTLISGLFTFGSPSQSNALPVSWLYLQSDCSANHTTVVKWATATERNADYFEIQRCGPEGNFKTIGSTPSKAINGMSMQVLHYQFTDPQPATEVRFYRIRQLDFDGSWGYSPIVRTEAHYSEKPSFTISDGKLTLHHASDPCVPIAIFNVAGQSVISGCFENGDGIALDGLTRGIYYVYLNMSEYTRIYIHGF